MRRLLGKETTEPEIKPAPLKAGNEHGSDPQDGEQAVARTGQTLAERLQAQAPGAGPEVGPLQEPTTGKQTNPGPRSERDTSQYSIVGQSMVIKGELEAAEDLVIAGRLEGAVKHTANRLIVGKTGVVMASIETQNLIVEGRVEGDIECHESVVLDATADVTGNIRTARLSIIDGARFNGQVVMIEAEKAKKTG